MGNGLTHMSAVEQGEGLAAVEDITVARLGIWLEVHDTSGWMHGGYRAKKNLTFQRCLGRKTARCSFLRGEREVMEEEVEVNSAVASARMEGGLV